MSGLLHPRIGIAARRDGWRRPRLQSRRLSVWFGIALAMLWLSARLGGVG